MRIFSLSWSRLGKCQAWRIPLLLGSLHPGRSSQRYSQPVELVREGVKTTGKGKKRGESEHMITEKEWLGAEQKRKNKEVSLER